MDDEKSRLIESLAEAISSNPQAEAIFNALIPDEPRENEERKQDSAEQSSKNFLDISSLFKMQSVLSALNSTQDDDRSRLLLSIRPFLSEEKQSHVDSAIKLLKIASILKLLEGLDLFKDFKL